MIQYNLTWVMFAVTILDESCCCTAKHPQPCKASLSNAYKFLQRSTIKEKKRRGCVPYSTDRTLEHMMRKESKGLQHERAANHLFGSQKKPICTRGRRYGSRPAILRVCRPVRAHQVLSKFFRSKKLRCFHPVEGCPLSSSHVHTR